MNINEVYQIEDFYTKEYNEDNRLELSHDRRHATEIAVKEHLLKKKIKSGDYVCEIGAGKGFWVGKLLDMGCYVKAYDLVQDHVDAINKKYGHRTRFLGAEMFNIVEGTPKYKGTFDYVLLSGPIYHLKDTKDKIEAINNSKVLLTHPGIMYVDFLSPVNAALEYLLTDRSGYNGVDTKLKPVEGNIFSYNTVDEMKYLCSKCKLISGAAYPLDGISRLLGDRLENMSEESWKEYLDFMMELVDRNYEYTEAMAELSEHNTLIVYTY